jgi:hypothetical protein
MHTQQEVEQERMLRFGELLKSLPKLTGTAKQVQWALSLRNQQLDKLTRIAAVLTLKSPTDKDRIYSCILQLTQETAASAWIANRNDDMARRIGLTDGSFSVGNEWPKVVDRGKLGFALQFENGWLAAMPNREIACLMASASALQDACEAALLALRSTSRKTKDYSHECRQLNNALRRSKGEQPLSESTS